MPIKEINIPEKIDICGITFIIHKKNEYESSFDFNKRKIELGIKWDHEDDIIERFIHEISEIIHVELGNRYFNSANNSYVFVFDHSMFQTHNEMLINTLISNNIINV